MKLRSWTSLLILVVAALFVWGLAQPTLSERSRMAEGEVLAVVGDIQVTKGEVEAADPRSFVQAQRQLFELTERTLENIITTKLLQLEARERGVAFDEVVSEAVEKDLVEPTDEEIQTYYEARGGQGAPEAETVVPQIRELLKQEQRTERYGALLLELREKFGVTSSLEPQRTEMAATGPATGPEDAPVTIIEFADFECPFCSRVLPAVARIKETHGDDVRFVYRHFPLRSIHRNAQKAAEAAACAEEQGRFWELHDLMFAEQRSLSPSDLSEKAERLGLEMTQFSECFESERYVEQIESDLQVGREAGLTGTPAFFINGRFLSGAQPYEVIAKVVEDELIRARSASSWP